MISRPLRIWERPFAMEQDAMDRFVNRIGRLPGIVQLAAFPLVIAISLLHAPIALLWCGIGFVVERVRPTPFEMPSENELVEWIHTARDRWIVRHNDLRESNPVEVADAMALPRIALFNEAMEVLADRRAEKERREAVAKRFCDFDDPEIRAMGRCLQQLQAS